jgi:thiosulfate/3-mercaptopyruvate sulfurtransferase
MRALATIVSATVLLLSLVTIAAQSAAQSAAQPKDKVDQPRSEMLVSPGWLAAHLRDSDLVILCIADDQSFYSAGHIPGARLIRLSEIVTTRAGIPNQLPTVDQLQKVFETAGLSNGSRTVLYGERSGMLAARAYFTLDYLGLADRAALLDGGIERWRIESRAVTTDVRNVPVSHLQIHPHREIVVDTSQIAEYARNGNRQIALIDARPPLEYTGEKLSRDVLQAGHIPSAKNLYWRDLLSGGEAAELRLIPELRDLFAAAGASTDRDKNKEVISYCRTGLQSSFDYFVAKYLGYRARMYVGSFYEWTRSARTVERSAVK